MKQDGQGHSYLDPAVLNNLSRLELKAKEIVEGFISGLHKSPYRGFSVEFAQHREYVPGDDVRYMDWKVFGRSDRYYIKQFEEETNLISRILLDVSESMSYSSTQLTKYVYGCYVAASLSYLILRQQDAVGMATFDDEIRDLLRNSSHLRHLTNLLEIMDKGTGKRKTDVSRVFSDAAERMGKRGIVIIVSDLFDSVVRVLKGIQHFRHKGHEVIVMHILDPSEVTFPFDRMTLFEGLEEYPQILANPRAVRGRYLEEVNRYLRDLKAGCLKLQVDYRRITTDQPLDVALAAYLAARAGELRR